RANREFICLGDSFGPERHGTSQQFMLPAQDGSYSLTLPTGLACSEFPTAIALKFVDRWSLP
ncbi:MAG TPA: hypothetical protein PKE16_14310, partial [Hyphomicrobium sp.]|nr:hypothetical protein [Hyphomicrobium sp.]